MSDELVARFEKRYRRGPAIGLDLRRPARGRSVTVLFGPSGSGKSTILRSLAGLERPESGTIMLGDEPWLDADRRVFRSPQQRRVGYLFQDFALFPHMTVAQNIAYPLRGLHRNERIARVGEFLDRFGLGALGGRFPRQISGGQQQRAALARALARTPRLLLLDEPLSSLDAPTRDAMRRELADILAGLEIPVFVVTHETREAAALGDSIVVLDDGRALQEGTVEDVLSRPAGLRVAGIVGVETIARGRVTGRRDGLAEVMVGAVLLSAVTTAPVGSDVDVCIRAADVALQAGPPETTSARNRMAGRVTRIDAEDATVRVEVDCGMSLASLLTRQSFADMGLAVGAPVTAIVKATAVHVVVRPARPQEKE